MKKILLISANQKNHTITRIIKSLENKKISFDFVKWSSLVFRNNEIKSLEVNIDFKKYHSAFIDAPSFNLITTKNTTKLSFRLENELRVLLQELKEKNIFVINGDFMREYPYYNKFTQSQIYSEKKIPTIPTIHIIDNKLEKVLAVFKLTKLNFPIVTKLSHGGMGEQVWKIKTRKELAVFLKTNRNANLIYQPFLKNTGDYRVLIVNGKSIGVMKRIAKKGEWKNNFALGGSVKKHTDKKMEVFVEKICQKIGLEYAGVDIFKFNNQYLVIEINIFACFEGFELVYPNAEVGEKLATWLINAKKI